jgi:hypothetical protein
MNHYLIMGVGVSCLTYTLICLISYFCLEGYSGWDTYSSFHSAYAAYSRRERREMIRAERGGRLGTLSHFLTLGSDDCGDKALLVAAILIAIAVGAYTTSIVSLYRSGGHLF